MLNFTCRIDNELYDSLIQIAEDNDRSLIGIVREACKEYVTNQDANMRESDLENALIWVDRQLRADYYDGLHPDGVQGLVTSLEPIMKLIHTERKSKKPIERCRAEWGSSDYVCFLEKGHNDHNEKPHTAFQNGTLYYWDKTNNKPV